jgi:spermidine synthase
MPTTYYAPGSGVGLVLGSELVDDDARISVVGLGAGTLSCYARPGQHWTFYEIDPLVVEIASDFERFSFLSRCLPKRRIAVGDARLTLSRVGEPKADVLIIDAFSSDSIPVHLLTREAFRIYRERLKSDGLLLVHISNRYLRLEKVLSAEAAAGGWAARVRSYRPTPAERLLNYDTSTWILMSPSASKLRSLPAPPGTWMPLRKADTAQWSDDHASVLPIIKL